MIFKHRFTLAALMTLLVASLAGCSQEEPSQPDAKKDSVILRLAIDTGLDPSSRAAAPDYFEAPSGDFEKIYTLRVILVKNGDDEVEANRLVRTTETGTPVDDNLEFKVRTGSKSVYLIANEASLPVPDNFAGTGEGKYTGITAFLDEKYRPGTSFSSEVFSSWLVSLPGGNPGATAGLYSNIPGANGLPLTEFFNFNIVSDNVDPDIAKEETQTVHLFLTRAAAKATFNVEVAPDYKGSGVNITGIRLNGLNWQQYVFPRSAVYTPEKDVEITPGLPGVVTPEKERYITSFTTPARVNNVTGANVTMNLAADDQIEIKAGAKGTVGPLYIPESLMPVAVATNPAACFNVQVQLDGENWLDAKMLGNDVAGTNPNNNILLVNDCQAIARNTHLKVTIGFSDKDITADVELVPYISVVLRPSFGFEEFNPNQNN